MGKAKGDCGNLSSKFYTLIPHDFGMTKMSTHIIKTKEQLKAKLDLVEQLADIEIAKRLLDDSCNDDLNELDANYKKLKCKLNTIDKSNKEFKLVNEYL